MGLSDRLKDSLPALVGATLGGIAGIVTLILFGRELSWMSWLPLILAVLVVAFVAEIALSRNLPKDQENSQKSRAPNPWEKSPYLDSCHKQLESSPPPRTDRQEECLGQTTESTELSTVPPVLDAAIPGGRWWEEQTGTSGRGHGYPASQNRTNEKTSTGMAPLGLSSYESPVQIVQCPQCGGFQLEFALSNQTFTFRCLTSSCGKEWTWRAGEPWPITTLRPSRPARKH
jgi:hypothetical protein